MDPSTKQYWNWFLPSSILASGTVFQTTGSGCIDVENRVHQSYLNVTGSGISDDHQLLYTPAIISDPHNNRQLRLQIPSENNKFVHKHTAYLPQNPFSTPSLEPSYQFIPIDFSFHQQPVFVEQQNNSLPSLKYGDCAESLPLAVIARASSQVGPRAEVSSLAAFTSKLCGMNSLSMDGSINELSIPLKPPCTNCEDLLSRMPGSGRVMAGSGRNHAMRWKVCKQGDYKYGAALLRQACFSYPAAHTANEAEIYRILEALTAPLAYTGMIDVGIYLTLMWHEFIVPYRDKRTIFRLNSAGEVAPVMIPVNNTMIPICTVFCAIGYILSVVLDPPREYELTDYFIPLLEIYARWCHTLCPWGHPNVISIIAITSWAPPTTTRLFLGTSKPMPQEQSSAKVRLKFECRHLNGMQRCRALLLQQIFGWLPSCFSGFVM